LRELTARVAAAGALNLNAWSNTSPVEFTGWGAGKPPEVCG
jgi:hypothetical protein